MLALRIARRPAAKVQAPRIWAQRVRVGRSKLLVLAQSQLARAAAWMRAVTGLVITAPWPIPNPAEYARYVSITVRQPDRLKNQFRVCKEIFSLNQFFWPVIDRIYFAD